MACSRNRIADELINYIESLGITVNTKTKARGYKGFMQGERIDISRRNSNEYILPILMHEFAHYIHIKRDKKLSSLSLIFNTNDENIKQELISVTNFVDENSLCKKLIDEKQKLVEKIKLSENTIKQEYPQFKKSEKFKEFEKYIKKSKAKYLLKHDRVKVLGWFSIELLSIDRLERDFPNMPRAFMNYIKMCSLQRKRTRITKKISRLNRYYGNAGELFARFVEGLCIDESEVKKLAPRAYEQFFKLLDSGYYGELKNAFLLIRG